MSKEKSYYDYWNNNEPVCPYCDSVFLHDDVDQEYISDRVCDNCNKEFVIKPRVEVKYQTLGDCLANGDLPHKFKRRLTESSPYECENCHREFYKWQLAGGEYEKFRADEYVLPENDTVLSPDL